MKTICMLACVFVARIAWADTPWEEGVAPDRRATANALFAEGNVLFARQAHGAALEKYQAAIALWDHPLIRFNLAVTLIRMDRILEAADSLDGALRFGSAPFSDQLYQQALDYQKLISGRVGTVETKCELAGARIALDGKDWFHCPGTHKLRVLAGPHLLVGERDGYLTRSQRLLVSGGETSQTDMELELARGHWYGRWYVLAAAGVLVAGAGGAAIYFASRDNASGITVHGMTN